ncbi:MAG: dihydrofolate reductase [Opitutae bacterium]|nr:dihydrofolate reductase [Opitutae bacterium]
MAKPLNLIVASAENRVIGQGRRLPFHIPEDKAWFHAKTANTVCVLGRICYEIWPRVLLDGRQPVVITSQPAQVRADAGRRFGAGAAARVRLAPDVPAALAAARRLPGEIMVCGGQRIYEETLPLADRLLLTLVHADVPGDVFMPEWRHLPWRETWRKDSSDANHRYTFSILERAAGATGP